MSLVFDVSIVLHLVQEDDFYTIFESLGLDHPPRPADTMEINRVWSLGLFGQKDMALCTDPTQVEPRKDTSTKEALASFDLVACEPAWLCSIWRPFVSFALKGAEAPLANVVCNVDCFVTS